MEVKSMSREAFENRIIQRAVECGAVKGVSPDVVNHPAHYTQGKVECIDAIESAVAELKSMDAVLTGNIIKYMWRWKHKNGVEDLRKARFCLDRLIGLQKDKPDDYELGAGGTTD